MLPMQDLPAGVVSVELATGGHELVVAEAGLMIDIHGTQLLTMRTPQGQESDLDWAVGFLASEGMIATPDAIKHLRYRAKDSQMQDTLSGVDIVDEIVVELHRPSEVDKLGSLTRSVEIRPGCGICGVASATALASRFKSLGGWPRFPDDAHVLTMTAALRSGQRIFPLTGGSHGCALFDIGGNMLALAEDVGRHNALDKAAGRVLRAGGKLEGSICVLSGRGGYELILKAAYLGCRAVVSVGAASSFAIEIAQAAGMRLIGFVASHEDGTLARAHVYASGRTSARG